MNIHDIDLENTIPPSPEEIRDFIGWLMHNGVPSAQPRVARTADQEKKAMTYRLMGVPAAGAEWNIRLGTKVGFPSLEALSIQKVANPSMEATDPRAGNIMGNYDAESGLRCLPDGRVLSNESDLIFYELDAKTFQEIVAWCQVNDLETIKVNTSKKWGFRDINGEM